jgi:arylsulfatase
VLPLDNSKTTRLDPAIRPSLTRGRTSFTYSEGMTRIPEGASPDMKNKSYTITADVEVKEGTSGMIVTQGGLFGGTALYFDKGRPVFHYNFVDVAHYEVAAKDSLAPGKHTIRFEFTYDGGGVGKGGTGALFVDDRQVAQGRIERTVPLRVTLDESLDVGEDTGTPVNLSYDVPFKFTDKLNKLVIVLK